MSSNIPRVCRQKNTVTGSCKPVSGAISKYMVNHWVKDTNK